MSIVKRNTRVKSENYSMNPKASATYSQEESNQVDQGKNPNQLGAIIDLAVETSARVINTRIEESHAQSLSGEVKILQKYQAKLSTIRKVILEQSEVQNKSDVRQIPQFVIELKGQAGEERQVQAFEKLGQHLKIVAAQYLWQRRNDIVYLSHLSNTEIENYAQAFAQEVLFKLTEDNFRRLDQYKGMGKFTVWAAQAVINCIRDELRQRSWHHRTRAADRALHFYDATSITNPEQQSISNIISERIRAHLATLLPKSSAAVMRCLIEGEPAAEVASEMGISVNALYILLSRAKASLRAALEREGFSP